MRSTAASISNRQVENTLCDLICREDTVRDTSRTDIFSGYQRMCVDQPVNGLEKQHLIRLAPHHGGSKISRRLNLRIPVQFASHSSDRVSPSDAPGTGSLLLATTIDLRVQRVQQ